MLFLVLAVLLLALTILSYAGPTRQLYVGTYQRLKPMMADTYAKWTVKLYDANLSMLKDDGGGKHLIGDTERLDLNGDNGGMPRNGSSHQTDMNSTDEEIMSLSPDQATSGMSSATDSGALDDSSAVMEATSPEESHVAEIGSKEPVYGSVESDHVESTHQHEETASSFKRINPEDYRLTR